MHQTKDLLTTLFVVFILFRFDLLRRKRNTNLNISKPRLSTNLDLVVSKQENGWHTIITSPAKDTSKVVTPVSVGVGLTNFNLKKFVVSHKGSKTSCTLPA